jgi:uncharacterized membrane protein YhiD involved in acid resistance
MACGAGYYWPAAAATGLTIAALWPLRIAAHRLIERVKPEEDRVIVELQEGQPLQPLLSEVGDIRHLEVTEELDRRVVHLELGAVDEELLAKLADLPYVVGVRWHR